MYLVEKNEMRDLTFVLSAAELWGRLRCHCCFFIWNTAPCIFFCHSVIVCHPQGVLSTLCTLWDAEHFTAIERLASNVSVRVCTACVDE